jgi:hypothetical protein
MSQYSCKRRLREDKRIKELSRETTVPLTEKNKQKMHFKNMVLALIVSAHNAERTLSRKYVQSSLLFLNFNISGFKSQEEVSLML